MKKRIKTIGDSRNSPDYEFVLTPSRFQESSKHYELRGLEMKNLKLLKEIDRIDSMMHVKTQRDNQKQQSEIQILNHQLHTAQKKIKFYQRQIEHTKETGTNGVTYIIQLKQLQTHLKQKEQIYLQTKKQAAQLKKLTQNLSKKILTLKSKEPHLAKSQQLRADKMVLKQKLNQTQENLNVRLHNFHVQGIFLFKLEEQFIHSGGSKQELLSIKNKYSLKKKKSFKKYLTSINQVQLEKEEEEEKGEVKNVQNLRIMRSQIQLLQKVHQDNQVKMQNLEIQKIQAEQYNRQTKTQLNQIESQIKDLERKIKCSKKMIDPKKLKPLGNFLIHADRSEHMKSSIAKYSSKSTLKNSFKNSFSLIFRMEEVGNFSFAGKKFSDRMKLGKSKSKIIGLNIFENNTEGGLKNIVGMQCVYDVEGRKKRCALNMISDIKMTQKKSFFLEDKDYINYIQLFVDEKGIIVGMGVKSLKGQSFKAGQDGTKKILNIGKKQYPISFYGSIKSEGFELLGCEIGEQ